MICVFFAVWPLFAISKPVVSATHPPLQCFSSFALASAKIDIVFESAKFLANIFQKNILVQILA